MKTEQKVLHKIIQGDCLEIMKKIPNASIDYICSDFPYNISNQPGLTMRGNKIVKADFGDWDKRDSTEDYFDFVFQVCQEYQRILKPNASLVLFFGYRHAGRIAYELERRGIFTFRSPIILSKKNPQLHYKKTGFRSCFEEGLWLVNDRGSFSRPRTFHFLNQGKMKNVLQYSIGREGGKQTQHPTEKPEFLIQGLIEVFTNPGDIVLDSFAGGGTTGVAGYKVGRNAISIEKEPNFVRMIQKRQRKAERKRE